MKRNIMAMKRKKREETLSKRNITASRPGYQIKVFETQLP